MVYIDGLVQDAVFPLLTHWRYCSLALNIDAVYAPIRPPWFGFLCDTSYHMMTSSNGNIFRVTGHLCGEFTAPGEFPAQRPVTRSFDVFFDLRLNKRLSKQSWGWWFETLSRSLWRHCNEIVRAWPEPIKRLPLWVDRLLTASWWSVIMYLKQNPVPMPWHKQPLLPTTSIRAWLISNTSVLEIP